MNTLDRVTGSALGFNEIAIGNCLKRYHGKIPFVSGCPPPSDAYLELIARGLRGDFKASTASAEGKVVDLSGADV